MEPGNEGSDEPTIVALPTAELKPKTLIHQLLEDVDNLEAMFVVTIKNGNFVCSWTNATVAQLVLASTVLEAKAKAAFLRGDNTFTP